MFDNLIRRYVSNAMNGDNNTSFAMAGIKLEQSNITPSLNLEELIKEMTLEEKIDMLGGKDNLAIKGLPRLNIPDVWCTDASAGTRCYGRATAFPVPLALTATWSRDLQRKTGEAIAEECRAKGVSVLLGPGVNIYRVPTNGRNFEYMGEDPYLASELAVPYIKGVQSRGVITTIKHFACNNSDYDRHRMNSEVDRRTLEEIYFPAFKAAVQKADSKSVMCAYNPVNGVYASENRELLTDILRDEWGFKGFVISDWTCVYNSQGPVDAGLDLEMPFGKYMNAKKLLPLLKKGKITEKQIDDKIRNIMGAFFDMGIYSRPLLDDSYDPYSDEHSRISLDGAREAIVLLKNSNNILPLDPLKKQKIVVIGFNAEETTTCGGGSCCIKSYDKVNILDGLRDICSENCDIQFIRTNKLKPRLTKSDRKEIESADVVLLSVGFTHIEESECYDRSWELPFNQNSLIEDVAELNSNTVVILTAGGGVETESWLNKIPALLHTFYLGENAGTAISEVLFGKVNPSGKLPFTMGKKWDDFASNSYYVIDPGKISPIRILGPQGSNLLRKPWTVKYGEKLMVGYRHFDTNNIEPQFPFGYGGSYTEFNFSDIKLSSDTIGKGESIEIRVTVSNAGNFDGAEVVQLYIRDEESELPRPDKELKGFEKVFLKKGESKEVVFSINEEHLSYYNDKKNSWITEPGNFTILIGNSSRNILSELSIKFISS